ncbi:MAG: restriction endonuclease subunit S [bacterium]|nr:restriction endonuclease subunit S [bacterium]
MKNYPTKKLGDVCEVKKGKKPELFGVQTKTRLSYLEAKFLRGTKESKFAEKSDRNSVPVDKGDLIIICDGSKSGDVFSGFEGVLSSTMGRIDFDRKQIEKVYLELFLKTKFDLFNSSKKGAAIPHLDFNIFNNLQIPLPPLAEQKKIVARLEGLLGKIKEAKRLRAEAQEAAQNLLLAELHRIFTQPPTPHKQHPNKLEFVSISGRQKPASVKNYGETQWEEKELGEICEHPQYGFTASSTRDHVGPKFLRITDIQDGKVDWDAVPYCKCPDVEKYRLAKGDIVFARTGATVGKSYLISETPRDTVYASYLIRLRAKNTTIPDFLYYFFQSYEYWQQINHEQVGMAQPNVNGSKLAKIKIPLPPVAEQEKIVARLDSLSEKVRRLQEYQKSTVSDFISLEQSILSKSFQ